jgi:mannose-6-phosphate isomerase-like protein (cupin superfamily)
MTSKPIEDPLFHQRYRFRRDGDVLRIEIQTEPGGGVLAEHVHPRLEERYEVLGGEVTFRVDGKPVVAGPGKKLVVPPGVRHSFENTGAETSHVEVEAEPALRLRESIEEGAWLMQAERFSADGQPRSLRALIEAAALAHRYRETVVLSSPPPFVQRLLFPPLARFSSRTTNAKESAGGSA